MSPGEKQAWPLNAALDVKRDILTLPSPDPNDDSIEAYRTRSLLLACADSVISTTLKIQRAMLQRPASDGIEQFIEERRLKALEAIAKMRADDEPSRH